jgi:hypothetical protein
MLVFAVVPRDMRTLMTRPAATVSPGPAARARIRFAVDFGVIASVVLETT